MRAKRGFLWLILLASVFVTIGRAAEPAGHWQGRITLPGQELEIDVDLALEGDAWSGDITIPAQGARNIPLEGIRIDGRRIVFSIQGVPGSPTFKGKLSEDGLTLAGDFTQGGQSFPFALASSATDRRAEALDALSDLDALVESALETLRVPGVGLGIVLDDELILARGFGRRDIEKDLPVTGDTLFAIGSATKAFTTFTMGLLVDEGRLDWDQAVASYLPGFTLDDPHAGAHLTPRDMVCHRSGLPRHDLSWYNNRKLSRAGLVERLRYLPLNRELRQTFQYNNLMYLTAGYLVERITGATWEEGVRTRIFEPLGMERSNFSVARMQEDGDHARPYMDLGDQQKEVDFRPVGAMGPAGSINSSAAEMIRWMRVHLGRGEFDGRPVISRGTLTELHTPQMVIPGLPGQPDASPATYALGWFRDTWRGHGRVYHGGNIDGFSALVTLFPADGLGVVALANKGGTPLPELVTRSIADRVLGLEQRDWIGDASRRREAAEEFTRAGESKKAQFQVKNTRPSLALRAYAGEYEHPGYGVAEITVQGKRLVLLYNEMQMPLDHWHYDVFNVAEKDDEVIPADLKALFRIDERGRLAEMQVGFEPLVDPIPFRRLPDRRMSDPAFLERLAGDYEIPGQKVTFRLEGRRLVLESPGQPKLELVPAGSDEFDIEGVTGFSIRFTVPDSGAATEAVFIQPNGVFPARRMTPAGD